jgi:hypothetical protein
MANVLSKSNIITGEQVDAWNITQSIDAFTGDVDYDITVSGSFQVTGSLKIKGTILGRTTQTSSLAITSSYARFTSTVTSASIASNNSTDQFTLQFYSPTNAAGLLTSSTYGIGAGEALMVGGYYGIVLPVNSIIKGYATVTSTCKSPGAMTSQIELMSGTNTVAYIFSNKIKYDSNHFTFSETPDAVNFAKGTRLWFRITTNSDSSPTFVSHNIILTLQPR